MIDGLCNREAGHLSNSTGLFFVFDEQMKDSTDFIITIPV